MGADQWRRAKLRDVADAAGVSIATASRALAGVRRVDPEVAERVRRAAAALKYRPDRVARALRRRETEVVGMIVPHISNPFFGRLMEAIEHQTHGSGRVLMLCDSRGDPQLEAERVDTLLQHHAAGLAIVPCHRERSAAAVERAVAEVPVVLVDRRVRTSSSHFVGVRNDSGVEVAVAHLHAQGCERLAFIGGSESSSAGHERLQAFESHAGALDPSASDRVFVGSFDIRSGHAGAEYLLAMKEPVDGVVCANDLLAIGAMERFRAAGLGMPEDVRLIGFDGIDAAAICHPALSTVQQPFDAIAEAAVDLLRAPIQGEPQQLLLEPTLIARASTLRQGDGVTRARR